jgi:hypothetical protein
MKIQSLLIILAVPVLLLASCAGESDTVLCVQLDPLEKVLKEQMFFVEKSDTAVAARGETLSYQFVVRSIFPIKNLRATVTELSNGEQRIPASLKAFVGYVRAGRRTPNPSRERLISASDMFPDPLIEEEAIDVASMSNQPLWFSFAVPQNVAAGGYTASVTFSGEENGKKFKITKPLVAKIYNVTLPEQSLWVTNWFSMGDYCLRQLNRGEPVAPYSERYWELGKVLANKMRDYGQNVYLISPLHLCRHSLSGTTYSFDFGNFDKTVELFMREGNLKLIEGGHLAGRTGDWSSPMGVSVPVTDSTFRTLSASNDTAKNFLAQFIPALHQHLQSKGWDSIYLQHIADEPIKENVSSYIQIANTVKQLMPGVKIVEANHSREVANAINVWVPQLDYYHSDYSFYRERQAQGDEVWFYTCLSPQGNYANRFLEQPLIQTRLLHWLNYRFGATGYLHWGLNYWSMNRDGESTHMNKEGGNTLPAGDSWIIYPAYGKVYGSIRLEAMRDGIADYALLQLLEEKHPAEAKELSRTVVYRLDHYDNNVAQFRRKRAKILQLLSE